MDDMLAALFKMIGDIATAFSKTKSQKMQSDIPDTNAQAHKSKRQRIDDLESEVDSFDTLFGEILNSQRQIADVLREFNNAISVRDETIAELRRRIETLEAA